MHYIKCLGLSRRAAISGAYRNFNRKSLFTLFLYRTPAQLQGEITLICLHPFVQFSPISFYLIRTDGRELLSESVFDCQSLFSHRYTIYFSINNPRLVTSFRIFPMNQNSIAIADKTIVHVIQPARAFQLQKFGYEKLWLCPLWNMVFIFRIFYSFSTGG